MKTLTLNDLLIKAQPVDLKIGEGTLTVWIRPLSQIDRELAQAGARGASRRYRKELEDPNSEDHKLLISDALEDFNVDQLRELWVQARLFDRAVKINRQSLENRDKTYIDAPEGEDVKISELERYENELDEIEQQRESSVLGAVETAKRELDEEAKKVTKAQLLKDAKPNLIDNLLTQFFQREVSIHMIARATFTDEQCKKPFFKTSEEVRSLRPAILEALTNAHYGLLLEPEALKP